MRLDRTVAVLGCALSLTACGGGGGGNTGTPVIPAPPTQTSPDPTTPTPTPTPTTPVPPATPPVIVTGGANDTAEYRNSAGAQQANAIAAYNAGFTGANVTAAIIDTGIDTTNPEFAGRISAASASTAGNGTIRDEGGHGTAVAGVLGAARNDAAVLGIAYGASLLVLRTDTPGTCSQTNGCKHDDNAIARGIDIATGNGARVINISLGGETPNATFQAALARATAAGVVVVISAGNEALAQPDTFALIASNGAVARGLVIIAGATDSTGALASFSNRAGGSASHYLAALGVRLRSYDETGAQFLFSGTSFSAPLISGAVALLAQAFPNLTGAQIVSLLYSSADDIGAAGVDATYGNGRLNLVKAFAPRGATSLAGSAVAVSLTDNGMTSAPMGDAAGTQTGSAAGVILDGYGRAYSLDLGATLRSQPVGLRLAPALANNARSLAMRAGGASVAVSIAPGADIGRRTLGRDDAARARATAGMIATRLGRTAVALGFGESGAALGERLAARGALPFLVADAATATGFASRSGASMAAGRRFGRLTLGLSAEQGEAHLPLTANARRESRGFGYDRIALTGERDFGRLTLGLGASRLSERSTVLGARFGGVFGGGGATSDFLDATARLDGPAGWRLAGTMRRGWTRADAGGAALSAGRLATQAYAIDLTRDGLVTRGDSFALRIAQPLRVARGGYRLTLPDSYGYATGVTGMGLRTVNLAPRGRELDVEAAWGLPVGPGWLATNLYWRRDPGHVEALPADMGAAVRYGFAF